MTCCFVGKLYCALLMHITNFQTDRDNVHLFRSNRSLYESRRRYKVQKYVCWNQVKNITETGYHVFKMTIDNEYNGGDSATNRITYINTSFYFNRSISEGQLSNHLTHLTLDHAFDQPLHHLPETLRFLIARGELVKHPRLSGLPSTLEYLELSGCFDHELTGLPRSLKRLLLGNAFNQPIKALPPELTHFSVGDKFNQPLDGVFAACSFLNHLAFGKEFNQPLSRAVLPKNLLYLNLRFCEQFNYSIADFPTSLLHLDLGYNFTQSLAVLPPMLIDLHLSRYFNQKIGVPHTLERFSIDYFLIDIAHLVVTKRITVQPSVPNFGRCYWKPPALLFSQIY